MPVNIKFNHLQGGYELANNLKTEIAGMAALDAVQGKMLNDKIKNHEQFMNNSMQTTYISLRGWYRCAVYEHFETSVVIGALCNGVEITIKRTYSNTNNEIHKCSLLAVCGGSRIVEMYGACNTNIIKRVRHVVNIEKKQAYIDLFYDSNDMNGVLIQLDGTKDVEKNDWKAIPMTQVKEIVQNEQIYSTLEFSVNATPAMKEEVTTFSLTPSNNSKIKYQKCRKIGKIIHIVTQILVNTPATGWLNIATIPEGFRPSNVSAVVVTQNSSDDFFELHYNDWGNIDIHTRRSLNTGYDIVIDFVYFID